MTTPAFTHGTTTGYTKYRCACPECRQAWRDYQRAYYRDVRAAGGRHRLVPAKDARRHIAKLRASGVTVPAIYTESGVSRKVLLEIRRGTRKRIRRTTEERILGVRLGSVVAGHRVPAQHAVRLMDEMEAAGVLRADFKEHLHMTTTSSIARQAYVEWKTFAKLVCLYRHMCRKGLVSASVLAEVGA